MRHLLQICAIVALSGVLLTNVGCRSNSRGGPPKGGLPTVLPTADCDNLALRLDRSDWMVNQGTRSWRVVAHSAPNRPPEHIGFLIERRYKQMRGGPEFKMYSVTTRNRNEQIGQIDQLGRAMRYEPQRDGGFANVPAGTNTRELNVAAIFETNDRITLEATSARREAFSALDVNGDGKLQPAETTSFGDRITGADLNRDGFVDFEEFDQVDIL